VPVFRIAPAPTQPAGPCASDSSGGQRQAAALLEQAEVRDVLAWVRLIVDPGDAAAVVRALARPPIELRQVDLARVIQLARRRKLDLVSGLTVATESPQVPPEARERIQRFLELYRSTIAGLDTAAPDAFMGALIERLGMDDQALIVPADAAERHASLAPLHELVLDFARRQPQSTPRELARHLMELVGEARDESRTIERSGAAPPAPAALEADQLQSALQLMREEVLASVARIGSRLGELRLDTDLDISHGVVRYLELLKLAALLQRPAEQSVQDALSDLNTRLLAAATPLQREIFQTSTLDESLLAEEQGGRSRARAVLRSKIGQREGPSLGAFLPRKGVGLALSASDIETYCSCPLRYKFARVLRIPTPQTLNQRFGIAVHRVLERYHSERSDTLAQMLGLFDASWRRGGFGDSEPERELRDKARVALTRYHARLHGQDSKPVWFERAFAFRLGPHHLRGRVDRVDRLATGTGAEYELIDYKTSRPKQARQLKDDVQLSLYALAAREAWQLESSRQAYYYVLDDRKVPVRRSENDAEAVKDTVLEVGEGILAQRFEPTPSHAACSICDYRLVCPAAER
jgi:CRISPR/Cas system-associated exonuclease Cas4 (RecB family)